MTEPVTVLDTAVEGAPDGMGGTIPGEPTERTLRHPYAHVAPVGSEERLAADQHLQPTDLKLRLPWDAGVEDTDRITVRGQTLEVVRVDPLRTEAVQRVVYARAS